jgi:hypothetical protein
MLVPGIRARWRASDPAVMKRKTGHQAPFIVNFLVAERVGFEPTNTLRCYLTSNQAPSTARPSLRRADDINSRGAWARSAWAGPG